MNQGKLEVVKQETTSCLTTSRVSVDILGISELKWTEMGEFNSDDHYIYYRNLTQMTIISTTVGRNPLEEME